MRTVVDTVSSVIHRRRVIYHLQHQQQQQQQQQQKLTDKLKRCTRALVHTTRTLCTYIKI